LIGTNLDGLLDVECLTGLVEFEGAGLQIYSDLRFTFRQRHELAPCIAQKAVALDAAPHQMRSRNPSAYGSRRNGGLGNMGRGFG
jgi:hypothetical protein